MAPDAKFVNDRRSVQLRAAMGVQASKNWRSITVEGCRVAIEEAPNTQNGLAQTAQTIVCLHTAGSGSREFRPLLLHPPAGARIILLDWPGHGRSADCGVWKVDPIGGRPQLESPSPGHESRGHDPGHDFDPRFTVRYCVQILHQVLNKLAIRRPILVGSGFGAAVAIRYAADHPSRPLGLVLCQPAGLIPPTGVSSASRPSTGWRRSLAKRLPGPSAHPLNPASKWQWLRTSALHPIMQLVIAEANLSLRQSSASLKAALRAVHCPVLFALARESREYRLKRYLALLEPLLASSALNRFTVFEGGFHPLWDEPERFSQALDGFLQSLLPLDQHQHSWLLTAVDWPTENTNLWKCVHPNCSEERVLPAGQNANADQTVIADHKPAQIGGPSTTGASSPGTSSQLDQRTLSGLQ
jgi:pimeloyl-ACP methyl ester carboxylesterase